MRKVTDNTAPDTSPSPGMSADPSRLQTNSRWPEGAIVYHVYPRSLQDSNGDGIGDLRGITSRLDYLKSLHIDALWLSPFYPSPMADFGYDVADYCNVGKIFGTLDDFRELLAAAGKRDMKVIIDLVPNHTSDEHPWFRASRQSLSNGYSDWYVWRNGHYDENGNRQPPNNWLDALTGRSAWQWDVGRQQYYLHSFHKRQPDLNWANPAVREAMKEVMRFWLDLGVDGFRVDAVYWMAKDPLLRDDAPNEEYIEGEDPLYEALKHDNSSGWPAVYSHLNELASVLKEETYQRKARFMVTEAYPERHNPVADYMAFYEGVDPQVAAPFNFEGVSLPWQAHAWHRFLKSFHDALLAESPLCVASYAFGNHDKPRLVSRIGPESARSAAVMLLTLPGMAFIYYGEELGMQDVPIPPDKIQDPAALGDPAKDQGRDPQRTPMQWSADAYAGFSDATEPWLPVAADYKTVNVDVQTRDQASFLSLYRRLGSLRHTVPALRYGSIEVLDLKNPSTLAYRRSYKGDSLLVLINFVGKEVEIELGDVLGLAQLGDCLVSSLADMPTIAMPGAVNGSSLQLLPHQAVVFSLVTQ